MTGRELDALLRLEARESGWRSVHFRSASVRAGRVVTPFDGDAGFPDLVLARRGSVLMLELKGSGDQLRPGQLDWLTAAGAPVGGFVLSGLVGKTELPYVLAHLHGGISEEELREALLPRLERAYAKEADDA